MSRVSRAERIEIWRRRMERYFHSKQTVAEFCQSEGVSVPSFYQWKRRLTSGDGNNDAPQKIGTRKATAFAELVVSGRHQHAQANLPNGVSIFLGSDTTIAATIIDRLVAYGQPAELPNPLATRRKSC